MTASSAEQEPRRPQVAVAQIGARRRYAVPRALHAAGMLSRLFTDAASEDLPEVLRRLLPGRRQSALAARRPQLPSTRHVSLPEVSLAALVFRRLYRGDQFRAWAVQNRHFCRRVAQRLAPADEGVYVFNGAGREILERARDRGLWCFVDQTSAALHVDRALLQEEAALWPGWEVRDHYAAPGVDEMIEREETEWQLAHGIVCGSEYVQKTLAARGAGQRCAVVAYPAPPSGGPPAVTPPPPPGPLRALFVGTLQLRKGLPYLLQAAKRMKGHVVWRLAGPSWLSPDAEAELRGHCELLGALSAADISRQLAWADVMVLPTLSEGSANVCFEALASATPVITTPNAGSVVEDGQSGFIVPMRDSEVLSERLGRLAGDRRLVQAMSSAARARAASFDEPRYSDGLPSALLAAMATGNDAVERER